MASCSRVTFDDVMNDVLASDSELSTDEDFSDSDEQRGSDLDNNNGCPSNIISNHSEAITMDEPCFRTNLLESDVS